MFEFCMKIIENFQGKYRKNNKILLYNKDILSIDLEMGYPSYFWRKIRVCGEALVMSIIRSLYYRYLKRR